jgi:hypothetical protein
MVNKVMTSRSKIVGITRHKPDQDDFTSDGGVGALSLTNADVDENHFTGDDENVDELGDESDLNYGYGADEPEMIRRWPALILPVFLLATLALWSVFFGFTYFGEARNGLASDRIISLISIWSLPACLVGIAWLLALRSSRSETDRFGDVARLLRSESDALQIRMRTVNEEIATARAFLAENARELESIGRQSARRLVEAAEQLGAALADSDIKAKTLEEASNAATTNLEQLRKHLPVVTSAAKDVTNQIGSAGNSAQVQVKSLIAGLQRVGEASDIAHNKISEMSESAAAAASDIASCIDHSAQTLSNSVMTAGEQSIAIAAQLDDASNKAAAAFVETSASVDQLVTESGDRMVVQVAELHAAIESLQVQAMREDERIEAIINRLTSHIETSATKVEEIDNAATERTVKLAFAVETITAASTQLSDSMAENHKNTEILITDAERLLLALDTANREVDESLPAAMVRIDERLTSSLSQLDAVAAKAALVDGHSDAMLAKIQAIQDIIETQQQTFDGLMTASSAHFTERHEQADALAAALIHTRNLLEEIIHSANDGLVSSLLRVRETTQQAAESSKKILDDELGLVAERLAEQNNIVLAGAVDAQVVALNDIIQSSVDRSISISEASTQKIAAQLAQIDEMTSNLEKRLGDAQSSFEGMDHDSFARQMVLLTESLNSTAIDVAKILSNDVTDTSWAAYLKGDRGVFTRRAVRLLDAGEARIIANHYSDDSEFREHVNRYIHDFESMMRVLLSTRDGNAIGVTLLSSDVGKLYVALAQAIERLRS